MRLNNDEKAKLAELSSELENMEWMAGELQSQITRWREIVTEFQGGEKAVSLNFPGN